MGLMSRNRFDLENPRVDCVSGAFGMPPLLFNENCEIDDDRFQIALEFQ